MTKTEQLNNLFDIWIKKRKCLGEESEQELNKFCLDGIIDENIFERQKRKVLFISNEANLGKDKEYIENCTDDYDRRENFKKYFQEEHDDWRGKLRERVSCLYQVLLDDYSFSSKPFKVAKSFAFMNLNKRGGENQCDIEHLIEYCKAYREEINREIQIIKPDVIVWLGYKSFDYEIPKILGIENNIFRIDNKTVPVIKMWHTSYTRIRKNAKRLNKFNNPIIDKQAYKLKQELKTIK